MMENRSEQIYGKNSAAHGAKQILWYVFHIEQIYM